MEDGVSRSSLRAAGGILPPDAEEPETRPRSECAATVAPAQAGAEGVRPGVGLGFFRGLLAASVMTAFFGLLVLAGFVLGRLS